MGSFTEGIVRFIGQMSYEQLPPAAVEMAKQAILDCLGVALAGSTEDASRIVSEYVRDTGQPEAGVIGEGFKTSIDQAAWVNGTKAHALDYDDYFTPEGSTPYHPTVAILPAVLAVAEKFHMSGKEALLAYITGFEVEARIAATCGKAQYDLGWHTTSTLGSLAATAAVARILKLNEEKTMTALGIAGSLAGGLRQNFGTMMKPLHAGNAARNGVMAAMLAQQGFTADSNILDGPLGFGKVLGGGAELEVATISKKGGTEYYIVAPGIALKPYPSCAYTHWAIDAALELRREAMITPDNITELECRTSSALPQVLIHSRPGTALEGKFSLEFCTAVALIDDQVSLKQFTDENVNDSVVQELIKRIRYVHPPEMGSGLIDLGGELVVKLRDGKTHARKIDVARGHPGNPLSQDELVRKYRDCIGPFLSKEDVDKSLELLLNLESTRDIAELMDIFTWKARL